MKPYKSKFEESMEAPENVEWKCEGNLVYQSMHAGYKKGVKLFKNKIEITVNTDRESNIDRDTLAELLCKHLNDTGFQTLE